MIEQCINSASACPALFTAATPPGGTAPTDTFQAALDIALNPTLNLTSLFDALPSSPDFSPILSSAPTSWDLPGSTVQIKGVSPEPAPAGTLVTIDGSGFGASQGSGTVIIGGVQANVITVWSDTEIVAVVPSDSASNGNVQVFQNGSASNTIPFAIGPILVPSISGLSLTEGPPQMGFTITGANFGSIQGASKVTLDGAPLIVLQWNSCATTPGSCITVQVPQTGASSGDVVVTVGGAPSFPASFTVTSPFACPTE
ncbi:IPT/TIG domain-containing protein [Edaphobacter acidisoli]|uniref:IPT/TIG domain-containing protein n=1 Tax=Edaphobacter acidisoli TaxID=2040573 RepID=UPI003570DCE3